MSDLESIEQEMRSLGWWYQHFDLPNGLRTGKGEGYDAQARWNLMAPHVPVDLADKTVLDLGGNAGFFSIQMKLRGASRCVLVDPFVEFNHQAQFAAAQFGVQLEIINEDAHIYCLTTDDRFDYVIFLGLLYHLKYPGLVLDRLAEMTKHRIYIQSNIIGTEADTYQNKPDYERFIDDSILDDQAFPKLMFVENLYNGDATNWWIPNYAALAALVRSAGLKVIGRPHPQVIVAEPEFHFGKVVYPKLVFPRYGKKGRALYPGAQQYEPELWEELIRRSRDKND
jgi:tRNA (mo5U34)-methyltransferase